METQQDAPEVLETPVEVVPEVEPQAEEAEIPDERDTKIRELEEKNKQLYARAKKAEEAKNTPPAPSQQETLPNKDIIYLAKADISADDVDEVLELAHLKKWDVQKAHKYLKPVLDERAEERKTAAVTHTKGGARGASKTTGEDLLQKAERTGEVPDTDEGMRALAQARLARRRNSQS